MIDIVVADRSMADRLAEMSMRCFSQPWSAASFEGDFDKHSVLLLATCDDCDAGFAVMEQSFGEGYISNVAVMDDYRRRGIGRCLAQRLLDEAKRLGLERILLDVRVSNSAAIALYRSCGFEILATRRDFYDKPREDGYTMQLLLGDR